MLHVTNDGVCNKTYRGPVAAGVSLLFFFDFFFAEPPDEVLPTATGDLALVAFTWAAGAAVAR